MDDDLSCLPFESDPASSMIPSPSGPSTRRHRRSWSSDSVESCGFDAPVSSDNIRALVRAKPLDDAATKRCLALDGDTITFSTGDKKTFTVDGVFPETASQADVFEAVGAGVVDNILAGYNGCIFAYGQTGSGKTHTMQGDCTTAMSADRGLIPRIMEYLFGQLDHHATSYVCLCSYLEIYNERVYDLLDDAAEDAKVVREDSVHGVFVQDLVEVPVHSAADALQVLALGGANRTVASTAMNRESSRSHSILTVKLTQTTADEGTRKATLHLVDLAGSEKQSHTGAVGTRLKEAAQINKSLSVLGNVITALVDLSNGLRRHVHYRDSKLTFLLRDALGGNSKTTVVATISAQDKWFNETLSTLQFVQRAKFIKNQAKKFEDDSMVIRRLEQEVASLKRQLEAPRPLDAVDEHPVDAIEPDARVTEYEARVAALTQAVAAATAEAQQRDADVANHERTIAKLRDEAGAKQATIVSQDKEIYAIKDTLGKIVHDTEIILDERNQLVAKTAQLEEKVAALEVAAGRSSKALGDAQQALVLKEGTVAKLEVAIGELQAKISALEAPKAKRSTLQRLFSKKQPKLQSDKRSKSWWTRSPPTQTQLNPTLDR